MKSCLVAFDVLHFPMLLFIRHRQITNQESSPSPCHRIIFSRFALAKCSSLSPCCPKSDVHGKKQSPKCTRHLSWILPTVWNTDVNNGPMLGCRSRASWLTRNTATHATFR